MSGAQQQCVSFRSPGGTIRFLDSQEHFDSAVLRLMHMDRRQFQKWLALAGERPSGSTLERLGAALPEVGHIQSQDGRRVPEWPVDSGPANLEGRLKHAWLGSAPEHGLAITTDNQFGWLVRADKGRWQPETEPPHYEEDYFEGDAGLVPIYGSYGSQADWRVRKAQRQVQAIQEHLQLREGRVLDVGSSYGFFRQALEEAGYTHDGLDVSDFARGFAEENYGFETYPGTLEDHLGEWQSRYDLITLWDVVEHLPDPHDFLSKLTTCLAPGGRLALKTPSLDCPEAECFGPFYHSLQRAHLVYFTPRTLRRACEGAGLRHVHTRTVSHLLKGFVGDETVERWGEACRGADFTSYFTRA